jgi:hypothetical protein
MGNFNGGRRMILEGIVKIGGRGLDVSSPGLRGTTHCTQKGKFLQKLRNCRLLVVDIWLVFWLLA